MFCWNCENDLGIHDYNSEGGESVFCSDSCMKKYETKEEDEFGDCPFCGHELRLIEETRGFGFCCDGCQIESSQCNWTKAYAIKTYGGHKSKKFKVEAGT